MSQLYRENVYLVKVRKMKSPARRKNPVPYHFIVGVGLTALLAFALGYFFRIGWSTTHMLACWLSAVNVVTFFYYGYDKRQAKRNGRRVPEIVLHSFVALGGSIGAYLAMRTFRHKTIKGKFRILFWCIVLFQLVVVGWIVSRIWF